MNKNSNSGETKKLKTKKYEKELRKLQGELCALQDWVNHKGLRVIIVFEGRDLRHTFSQDWILQLLERRRHRNQDVLQLRVVVEKSRNLRGWQYRKISLRHFSP